MFRRLFKDFAVYGLGDLILKALGFVTLPLFTRLLAPTEFGAWSAIVAATGLFSAVIAVGGDSAYGRYFFSARSDEERAVVTTTAVGALAAWSVLVTLIVLPFSGIVSGALLNSRGYSTAVAVALLGAPVGLMNTICGQALRNEFRAGLFAGLNGASTVLTVAFSVVGIAVLDLGVLGMFTGALAAGVVMVPIRLWSIRHLLQPRLSPSLLGSLVRFGAPLVPASLAYWVFASVDRLMLARMFSLSEVGLYAVAAAATSVLALIHGTLGQAWSPHAVQAYESDQEAARGFFGQVMTYIVTGFGILCVGVTVFGPELLRVLTTSPYFGAAAAIGPLSIGYLAYASTQVTAVGISLTKRTRYIALWAWVAAGANVGLNLVMIPRWGMLGASWATCASYVILTLGYSFTSQRLWRVHYETRRVVAAVLLTLGFTIIAPYLPAGSMGMTIAIKLAYCCGFAVALFLFGVLDKREWRLIRTAGMGANAGKVLADSR